MERFKNLFGYGKEVVEKEQTKQPNTRDILYVKKVGNGDYMVSHLALGGYAEYKKENNSDCWTSDGVPSGIANPHVVVPKMVKDTLIATTKCKESDRPKVYTQQKDDSNLKVAIMNHVIIRFAQLNCILAINDDVKVIIGGGSFVKNDDDGSYKIDKNGTAPYVTSLGRGVALSQWLGDKNGCMDVANEIEKLWKELGEIYNKGTTKRLFIGVVGFDHKLTDPNVKNSRKKEATAFNIGNLDPSEKLIHVWGANITNFNKSNHGGAGQADSMQHSKEETNPAGAFGIITTPINGGTVEEINKVNATLLETFFKDDSSLLGGSKPRNRTRSKKRRNSRKSK